MNKIGADYIILGSITEYGRKAEGEQKVFSSIKTQTVEAGVSIRLVEASTGLIIYSDEAKGFAETTTKQTMGVGGTAGFDATLSDKAISAALSQLVENIINKCMDTQRNLESELLRKISSLLQHSSSKRTFVATYRNEGKRRT